jgi:tetratricopeptide (TPR) repeat protein
VIVRAWLAVVALVLVACNDGPNNGAKGAAASPAPIPSPELAHVDPEVVNAIEAARAAVAAAPESGRAWGELGDRLLLHDFTDEAASAYARAEELDPESFVWPYRRAWSQLEDHPELALAPFERSLRALDDYAPAHEIYAHALVRNGRPDEAIAHFERALALDAANAHAHAGLAQVYLERGELARAQQHFKAALARDPKLVAAHAGMAQVELALGNAPKAKNHAELSRTLPPDARRDDIWARPNLPPAGARMRVQYALQLESQGQTAAAEEQYHLALASNPDYYVARSKLVQLLVARGERAAALELLREAERRTPESEQVRTDLAKLMAEDGAGAR